MGTLAKGLGLDSSKISVLVGALAPALMRGLQKQTESKDGLSALTNALQSGSHQQYLDNPDLVSGAATRADGNKILGHLFGSKDVSRNVAARAAEPTGIDVGLIKKALPLLASLTMGALSRNSNAGRSLNSSLPELLGGLVQDDFSLDDVLSLAKKFF